MGKLDYHVLEEKLFDLEKKLTKGLLKWKHRRQGESPPDEENLEKNSEQILEEAHRIVKKRGGNVFEELKQAKKEFVKGYKDQDEK